jgi:hypothetical protein
MSSVTSSTDAIAEKNSSTGLFLLPSAITPTLGQEFINGHYADNHFIFIQTVVAALSK